MIQLQFAEFDEWIPGPRGTDFNDTSVWSIQWVKCSSKHEWYVIIAVFHVLILTFTVKDHPPRKDRAWLSWFTILYFFHIAVEFIISWRLYLLGTVNNWCMAISIAAIAVLNYQRIQKKMFGMLQLQLQGSCQEEEEGNGTCWNGWDAKNLCFIMCFCWKTMFNLFFFHLGIFMLFCNKTCIFVSTVILSPWEANLSCELSFHEQNQSMAASGCLGNVHVVPVSKKHPERHRQKC